MQIETERAHRLGEIAPDQIGAAGPDNLGERRRDFGDDKGGVGPPQKARRRQAGKALLHFGFVGEKTLCGRGGGPRRFGGSLGGGGVFNGRLDGGCILSGGFLS